jgi:RimJ/RimL family protein N-acetyltransferase
MTADSIPSELPQAAEPNKFKAIDGLEIRYSQLEDGKYLKEWLSKPSVERAFPMADIAEVEDATARWISFARYRCSLTATINGVPCGIATLYLQPYRKLVHQCEFGIVIGDEYRNMGIGTQLLNSLMHLAKERFKIELLHLQVYAENPAIHLYTKLGFETFGVQTHWIKESSTSELGEEKVEYIGRVFMQRFL